MVKLDFHLKQGLPESGKFDLVPHKLLIDGMASAPLNQRAWVLQE
jgi:hypothetical protein